MDSTTSNNLLFLLSVSMVAASCSDDGIPVADSLGTTGGGGTTSQDGADSLTSEVTTATATSPSSTTSGTSSDTDGTSGPPPGSSDGSGSGDATVGGTDSTGEDPTGTTAGTTEGTTESGSSSSSTSTGGEETVCEQWGAFSYECFGAPGYPEIEEEATAYCLEVMEGYFAISEECGTLQEEFWACLVTLECIELGSVGSGSDCDDEQDAATDACM